MAGRLIDADELLKHKSDHETMSTHLIWNAPTVDPVRHGTWRNYKDEHTCSVCGEVGTGDWMYEDSAYDYCPFCGAKMDGERKEE